MAFTNNSDIEAALNECNTVEEWENFTGSDRIPEDLVPFSLQRFVDLSLAAITTQVSRNVYK